jgi:outer membrane protein assembly factor BamB
MKENEDEYAMLTFLLGGVTNNNVPAEIGDIVKESDTIVTAPDSFCDIRMGGSIIRIKENSKVIFSSLLRKENGESITLGMSEGKMLCKPKKLLKSESFTVKTPTAIAAVRGTQFTIETDKDQTTSVKVFSGKVKVAKRLKQFEGSSDRVIDGAPVINEQEKIVITKDDVDKTEKRVDDIIKKETAKNDATVMDTIIAMSEKEIAVNKNNIVKFALNDFDNENKEIRQIRQRPVRVIRKMATIIKEEKEAPKPDGRLMITRYEVYFIKNGKVLWEGKVIQEPVRKDGKVYIASGNRVFCASSEGPVIWRKNIDNDGKLEIMNNELVLYSQGKAQKLNPETGEQL